MKIIHLIVDDEDYRMSLQNEKGDYFEIRDDELDKFIRESL